MRNARGVELKRGYFAFCVDGAQGRILAIEKDNRGRPYVSLDSGNTVHADMIVQVLPPMRVLKGGVVKANPVGQPAIYTYHINLDERGDFSADVRNTRGKTVFVIEGFEIFEDGWMRSKTDTSGLRDYLIELEIMKPGQKLVSENPTPRVKHREQPSQRPHVNAFGKLTTTPDDRLLKRRGRTKRAPPGVWANPLTRVKVMSDPQRGGELTKRLMKRRKATKAAPEGFYANPVERGVAYAGARENAEPRNLLQYFVQWANNVSGKWRTVGAFASAAEAKIFAHEYARKHPEKTIRVATDD